MAFDPDQYLAGSTATAGSFDPDSWLKKTEEKTVMGGLKNAQAGLIKIADQTTDFLNPGPAMQRISSMSPNAAGETLKSIATYPINEAKRLGIGKALTGDFSGAMSQLGQAAYDQPIETAMDVMGGAQLAKGMGSRMLGKAPTIAPEAPTMAPEAPVTPEVPSFRAAVKLRGKTYTGEPGEIHVDVIKRMAKEQGIPEHQMYDVINKIGDQGFTKGAEYLTREEASQAAGGVRGEAASLRGAGMMGEKTASGFKEAIKSKIPKEFQGPLDEVKQFVSKKYEKTAQQPGFKDLAADAMLRRAQGMRFRELGGTPGQARSLVKDPRIGEAGLRELMDVAKEKGITKSPIGAVRRQAVTDLRESAGSNIGAVRKLASERGAIHDPNSLIDTIRQRLDAEYLGKGSASSEKGAYAKALEDIKSAASTPESLAKKITEMNKRATKNKMTQPTGAITDVANAASEINNNLIRKYLKPAEIEHYENSLRDFGASKIFEKLQSFEVGREMGGRAGVGGLVRNLKQGAMDLGGSKVMENFYDKFGSRLKSTPGATKNLASLGEGALEDILSSLDQALDEIRTPGR